MAIRWRQKDFDEVTKRIRQFNATITRATKKYGNVSVLPARLTTEEVRAKITTRAEFNREMNALKRFNIKTAKPVAFEGGLVTTKWQADEAKRLTRLVNRQRKKEAERLAIPAIEKGLMGTYEQNNLRPKKINLNKVSQGRWNVFFQALERQSRDNFTDEKMEQYKQNYLRSIINNLDEYGMELFNYVKDIPADVMYMAYYDDPVLQIGYTSDPLPVSFIAETALEGWKRIWEG